MLSKIRDAMPQTQPPAGQGGPSQDDLRRMLMRQDPAKYRNLIQRGFITGPSAEYMPQGQPAMADQLMNADNPAVQFAPAVVSATPARAVASPEELIRNDLIWRSLQSERGKARYAAKAQEDAALNRRIEHLRYAPVPAEYDDNYRGPTKSLMQLLRYVTGQGGGMR